MTDRLVTDELRAVDVMSRHFLSAAPEDTLGELAERLAEADAGSALVVEYGRLTGILTSRDVLRAVADRVHPSEGRVRDWMSAAPVTAAPELPADEAARLMLTGGFHHLPVTEDDHPVGVVGLRAVVARSVTECRGGDMKLLVAYGTSTDRRKRSQRRSRRS